MRRRDFLITTGAAGLAATSLRGARATAPTARPPRRLVLVFVTGGWDTSYSIEPKESPHVDVPAGAMQMFEGLDVFTDPSRPSITSFFEMFAANTAIVRGIATDGLFHNECQRRMACGKRDESQPDIGAMVAHDVGNMLPIPYLILGNVAFTGPYAVSAARLGTTNQIVDLVDGPTDPTSVTEDALLKRYAEASADRARATRGATGYNRRRVDDFAQSLDRSQQLRALRDRLGVRGETLSLTSQATLALDAIEHDISHSVMLTPRDYFDTHSNNKMQGPMQETLFADLIALVSQLTTRPGRAAGTKMIDDTVLVVLSEMSRTPHLNYNAGKDHWPITPAMVIGGGIKGGRTFGASTPGVGGMPIDLSTGQPLATGTQPMYSHFIAGLLKACGADPSPHFPDTTAFDAFLA